MPRITMQLLASLPPRPRKLMATALAVSIVGCTGSGGGVSRPSGTAASTHVRTPPINVEEIDSLVQTVVTQQRAVGLSVGVMQDGNVVLAKGYGFRSLDPNEPVTPATMFPIGSVTKQFTCTAALLLAEDGKLSMDDPVGQYLPTATRGSEVTLLDLGQHVTGYRDYYPLDFVVREMQQPESVDTIIARYGTRALDFEPGTRWSYSNTNFLMLGKAIETASGESMDAFLADRIFTPLGMARTSFGQPRADMEYARGYTSHALGPPVPAPPEAAGWIGAAGAIWSTPTDLLTWDLALIDGQVLSPASYGMLTTPRTLADGRSTGYGCGLSIRSGGDALVFAHGGAVAGSIAQNTVIPATRSAVVVFANADFVAMGAITTAILDRLTPHVDVPMIAGLAALDAARTFLTSLEHDQIDRTTLGDEFNALLTPERMATDRASLGLHGRVTDVRVIRTVERGGMEVAVVEFTVGSTPAQSLMYRTPDGKIQQFLIERR